MSTSDIVHRTALGEWPQALVEPWPKSSLLLWSGFFAAAIPLTLSLYWIALWLGIGSSGLILRVASLACSLLLALIWYRAPLSRAEVSLIWVLAAAALLLLIPTLMASEPFLALAGWIKTLTLFAFCCFLVRGLRYPPSAQVFGVALLTGAAILTLFVLYIYVRNVGLVLPTYKMVREFKGSRSALELSLNSIAFSAVFSYLAGLCLVRRNRLLIFSGLPLFLIVSVFSGSRAPFAILLASVFVLVCINGLRVRFLLLKTMAMFVVFATLAAGIAVLMLAPDRALSKATEGRWHLWSVGLHKFAERPLFGYGYDSWRDDLVSRLPGESELTFDLATKFGGAYHNQYITVLAEEGLIGATAAALVIWLLFRCSWLLAFRTWSAFPANQWSLFACIFLLLRAHFEVPGLFGYGQEPADYLAYVLLAFVLSRFSIEEDLVRLLASPENASHQFLETAVEMR